MGNEVKWVRVDSGERPEGRCTVLIVYRGNSVGVGMYENRQDAFADYGTGRELDKFGGSNITHWAHLPEPPEREG